MELLQKTLANLKSKLANNKSAIPALMTHVVLGYPSLKESIQIVCAMVDSGASLVELQIPFSDPLADGPTILFANEQALRHKIHTKDCLKAMELLNNKVKVPLLFMSYFNLLHSYQGGLERFLRDAKNSGAQGLIVPDIRADDVVENYWNLSYQNSLIPIPIVSPLSTTIRLKKIKRVANQGFVYCVSATATTGAKKDLPKNLNNYLSRVRNCLNLPLALGFGISKPKHIQALSGKTEIAIVGSATIDLIRRKHEKGYLKDLARFIKSLCFHGA